MNPPVIPFGIPKMIISPGAAHNKTWRNKIAALLQVSFSGLATAQAVKRPIFNAPASRSASPQAAAV